MGGQPDQQPVPGTTDQQQQEKSKTKTSSTSSADLTGTTSQTGATTGTSTPTLPPWLEEQLRQQATQYGQATDQYGNAIQDWRAAGFSPDQLAGFEAQRRAAGPGGIQQTALDELLATGQGKYLYGGEGFNAAVDAAYRAGMPNIISQFAGANRDQNFLGKANLAQLFSDAFARQYGTERGYQQQALQLLPGMSLIPGQTYQDIGKQYQALEQYGMNYPLESLYPGYLNALQGSTGFAAPFQGTETAGTTTGTTTTDQQTKQIMDQIAKMKGNTNTTGTETPAYFPGNQTAGLLGGALSGAGTGAMLTPGMPLLGAGIGAGIGIGSQYV